MKESPFIIVHKYKQNIAVNTAHISHIENYGEGATIHFIGSDKEITTDENVQQLLSIINNDRQECTVRTHTDSTIISHTNDADPILEYTNRLEEVLIQNAFVIDREKDERTTYKKETVYISLFWNGDILLKSSSMGGDCSVGMEILLIPSSGTGKELYLGKRPSTDEDLKNIFRQAGILDMLKL